MSSVNVTTRSGMSKQGGEIAMKKLAILLLALIAIISGTANAAQVVESGRLPGVFDGFKRDNLYVTNSGAWWQVSNETHYYYGYSPEFIIFYDDVRGYFFTIKGTNVYVAVKPVPIVASGKVVSDFDGFEDGNVYELSDGSIWQQTSFDYKYSYKYQPTMLIASVGGQFYAFVEGIDGKATVEPAY